MSTFACQNINFRFLPFRVLKYRGLFSSPSALEFDQGSFSSINEASSRVDVEKVHQYK
jgi:hypothetical protein